MSASTNAPTTDATTKRVEKIMMARKAQANATKTGKEPVLRGQAEKQKAADQASQNSNPSPWTVDNANPSQPNVSGTSTPKGTDWEAFFAIFGLVPKTSCAVLCTAVLLALSCYVCHQVSSNFTDNFLCLVVTLVVIIVTLITIFSNRDAISSWTKKLKGSHTVVTVFAVILAFLLGILVGYCLFSTSNADTTPSSCGGGSPNIDEIDVQMAITIRTAIVEAFDVKTTEIKTEPGIHNKTVTETIALQQKLCDSLVFQSSVSMNRNIRVEMPQGIRSVSSDYCVKFANISSMVKPYGSLLDKQDQGDKLALARTHELLLNDFYLTHKTHTDALRQNAMLALKKRLSTDRLPDEYDTKALSLFSADANGQAERNSAIEPIKHAWEELSNALDDDFYWRSVMGIGGFALTGFAGGVGYTFKAALIKLSENPAFVQWCFGATVGIGASVWQWGKDLAMLWEEPRGVTPTTKELITEFTTAASELSAKFGERYKPLLVLVDTINNVKTHLEDITESTTWEDLKIKLSTSTKDLSTALENVGISNAGIVDGATSVTPSNVQDALQYTTQVVDCGASGNSTQCQRPRNDTWILAQTVAFSLPFVAYDHQGIQDGVVPMAMFHHGLLNKFASIMTEWKDFIDTSLPSSAVSEINNRAKGNIPYVTLKSRLKKAIDAVPSLQQKIVQVIGKIRPYVLSHMIFPQRSKDGNLDQANLLQSSDSHKAHKEAYETGVIQAGLKILSHKNVPKNIAKFTSLEYDKVHANSRLKEGLEEPFFDRVKDLTGEALSAALGLVFDPFAA